jgi:zinc and cadmium transporter
VGVGNFLYIAAADLIPEVKRAEQFRETLLRFGSFTLGVALLYVASTTRLI